AASKVTRDVPQGSSIDADPLCCFQIWWFERGSFLRRTAERLAGSDHPLIRPWNIDWAHLWRAKPLTNGVVLVSNIGVPDYFRTVYAMDAAYLERQMRMIKAASTNAPERRVYGRDPTRDQQMTNRAWTYFLDFWQSVSTATN